MALAPTNALSLRVVKDGNVKTLQFSGDLVVFEVCRELESRLDVDNGDEYGLFLPEEDSTKGRWMEPGRTLNYYDLSSGDMIEYKKKIRPLRVKLMDDSTRMVMVDDSLIVSDLVRTVCDRIGINNFDEFSFTSNVSKEDIGEEKKPEGGIVSKAEARQAKKMQKLKKKLHTDDEVNWLNPDRSLREQGVDETKQVTLRKKFFFSDQNVDRNDPVQLNLLYVQSRDAILNGSHPCSLDDAIRFAALQMQVQHGDHDANKHKGSFVSMDTLLPPEYAKQKGLDKRIFADHRKLVTLNEMNAKLRYIQLCRSLKTYGVTFFLVKEKVKGKNKLEPRLLGVTRDSVLRVDERTKEVMRTWPLTQVRRWAASPNSFTLDFGDYSESYYSVQTTEGEAISKLIAGYIDIILKKKKDSDKIVPIDEASASASSDSISGHKAKRVVRRKGPLAITSTGESTSPAPSPPTSPTGGGGHRASNVGPGGAALGPRQAANLRPGAPPTVSGGGQQRPEQAGMGLTAHLNRGQAAVGVAMTFLASAAVLPPLGTDPASKAWVRKTRMVTESNVSVQLAAVSAAAARLINLTALGDVDSTALGSAVSSMASNIVELGKSAKLLAGLDEEQSATILKAVRELTELSGVMMGAVQSDGQVDRKELGKIAGSLGLNAEGVLALTRGGNRAKKETVEILFDHAKEVAGTMAGVVNAAKSVAAQCANPAKQAEVIQLAKDAAVFTSQLVTVTKLCGASVDVDMCQDQLLAAARAILAACQQLKFVSDECCDDFAARKELADNIQVMSTAVGGYSAAVNETAEKARQAEVKVTSKEETCQKIMEAANAMQSASGNVPRMVTHAKTFAQGSALLCNLIKAESKNTTDKNEADRLLDAAKRLAESTAFLVNCAKAASGKPKDILLMTRLADAGHELRATAEEVSNEAVRAVLMKKLRDAARTATASTSNLTSAVAECQSCNRNLVSQEQLLATSKAIIASINDLIAAERASSDPDLQQSATAQLELIKTARAFIPNGQRLLAACKAAAPTIDDPAVSMTVDELTGKLGKALETLKVAQEQAATACDSMEFNAALELLDELDLDLDAVESTCTIGKLLPLPSDDADQAAAEVGALSKTMQSAIAQLVSAARQGNKTYVGVAARDMVGMLSDFCDACRAVAATDKTKTGADRAEIVRVARDVIGVCRVAMDDCRDVVETQAARHANGDGDDDGNDDEEDEMALAMADDLSKHQIGMQNALDQVLRCLPGLGDVDTCIDTIHDMLAGLEEGQLPFVDGVQQKDLWALLDMSAGELSDAAASIVAASRQGAAELSTAARAYSEKLEQMVGMGAQLAAVSPDVEGPGSQSDCLTGLRNMVEASARLVESAKVLAADVNTPNGRTMLAMSARALTDSINSMLDNCIGSDTVAGTVECDAAARTIRGLMEQCETVDEPINDSDYFSCLDTTVGRSQALGECMTQIRACVRASEGESVAAVAAEASAAVTSLTEAVLQAAYLVGRADTSAVEAETGVVDQAEFARARQAILLACDALNAPDADQKKILATATVIAKHTSALCNGCKQASKLTTNPVAKQQFVSSAKAVAKSTGQLVATMKRLAIDPSDLHREQCADATQPLIDAVDVLCTYAGSPEFGAGVVFSLSPQALASQMPLLACVKSMVAAAQHFMETCKSGLKDPGDETRLKRLDADSANLAKTLRDVVNNVRQVAPGQEECQRAMDLVSISQHLLDKANLSATLGELEPRDESTLKGFQSHLLQNTQGVAELIMPLASAARGDPLKLGKNVSGLSNYLPNLVNAAIGVASHYTDPDEQVAVLDRVRTVVESAENLIESCRDAGGSTKASEAHTIVDGCAHEIRDACNDLIHTLESAAGNASIMERVVDQLQTLQTRVNEAPTQVNKSVDEYKRVIQDSARNLAKTAARAIAFSTTNPGELVRLGRDLVDDYAIVVEGMQGLEATTSNEEQQMSVHQAVLGLGPTLIALAGSCAGVDEIRNDVSRQKQLSEDARLVNDRVAKVLQAVRAGGRGLVACDTAANIIGQVSRDLETTAMFASAGTLSANDKGSGDHAMLMRSKEDLLRACKALMEGVKNMVSGATSSQEQLSEYAQSTAQTGVTMAKAAKDMATGMATDDRQAQEMILHAVTAVTATLADLFSATKSASGKPLSDPAMESLKDTSKTMVERISNVLKVVKSVDEQGQRAFRALEGAMESIATEIATLATLEPPKRQTSPEDVIQATKALAHATVRCVAAVGKAKTKEIVDGCQDVRRAMVELVQVSKGACTDVDFELQSGLYSTVRNAARDTHSLLGAVFLALEEENPAARSECLSQLNQSSSVVAGTVKTVIEAARELKGDDWVDPNDETAVAENELLSAAGAIEAAARKLAELKPRESARAVDEDLGFEEQIVEAATAIAQATSALVKAANQAQKEMNSSGGTFSKKKLTRANSTWSDGVASASRVVATATHNLVEQANMCVTGEGSQDSLVAAAKQVASTTAQLAVACRVNSDMKSKTQQRLNQAAQIVKKATDALVKAAEEASVFESTESAFKVDERFVGSIAQEMNIQEEILRKERELEGARRKLEQLRKAKYQE